MRVPSVVKLALIVSLGCTGSAVEIHNLPIHGVAPNGNLIFLMKSGDVDIPVAVRFLGLLRPLDADTKKRIHEALSFKIDPEKSRLQNVSWSIQAPGDRFTTDEHGVLLAIIIRHNFRIRPDGSRSGGHSHIAAELLEDGLCGYDGSLETLDPAVHRMYLRGQDSAKKNGQGIWREPGP